MDTSLDVFKELIELNYLGTVSLTKCVLPHMIERKQGKIVTVNSMVGIIAAPLSTGYCASKHALRVRLSKLNSDRTDLNVCMEHLLQEIIGTRESCLETERPKKILGRRLTQKMLKRLEPTCLFLILHICNEYLHCVIHCNISWEYKDDMIPALTNCIV